jgi:hypothetical protein
MNGENKQKLSTRILKGVLSAIIAAVLAVFVFVVINY